MTTLCHLFDGSMTWEHRTATEQLFERLPRDRFRCVCAAIDRPPFHRSMSIGLVSRSSGWSRSSGPGLAIWEKINPPLPEEEGHPARDASQMARVNILPRWFGLNTLAAPPLVRFLSRGDVDIIHAWGVEAASVARIASDKPIVVHVVDPRLAERSAKRLRTMSRSTDFAVVCPSGTTRRQLIEHGIDPSLVVVIRPGVDFAVINQARKDGLRKRLGIASQERVVLVSEPVTRDQGQFDAVWAAVLRNHLSGGLRVVVPGESPERDRIVRFATRLPTENPLILPDPDVPFEQLVAIADCLLVTPRGDVSTTAIAWAMAAGCAVIGSAVYSVAELISHKVNGLLFKQVPGRSMTAAILKCLDDRAALDKVRETARGQAYEVFSLRRFVDQHARLYENLLADRPVGNGISDSAAAG